MAGLKSAQTSGIPAGATGSAQGTWQPVTRDAIDQVVRQIVEQFHPQRIILFGSYAYGQPEPGSDVDLLVVRDSDRRETEEATTICQAIEYHFPLDLIVRTPTTLAQRLALGDYFLSDVVHKGVILYERPNT